VRTHFPPGAGWADLAHSVGSGIGVIVKPLLQVFDRVEASDPGAAAMAQAAELHKDEVAAGRAGFHVSKAEAKHDFVADGAASLVIAAEAAQCASRRRADCEKPLSGRLGFDIQLWYKEAARMLRPGGTLAYWFYSNNGAIASCPQAHAVWAA
jgi:hypothetical protein